MKAAPRKGKTGKNARRRKKSGKIGRVLALCSVVCILAAVGTTAAVFFIGSSSLTDRILQGDTRSAAYALTARTAQMKGDAENYAMEFASDGNVTSALEESRQSSLAGILKMVIQNSGADVDFAAISDPGGKILASTLTDRAGGSVAALPDVKSAMSGKGVNGDVASGPDARLAVRATAPVYTKGSVPLGYLSTGYSLEKSGVVDALKAANGCDYVIYWKNTGLSSSIKTGNARRTGFALDPGTGKTVSGKQTVTGKTVLFGETYASLYQPIADSTGKVVGVLFVGKPISEFLSFQKKYILAAAFAAAVLAAINIFLFGRISKKRIAGPIQEMSRMAADLAEGKLGGAGTTSAADDEIGRLGRSLGTMTDNLRRYVKDISLRLTVMAKGDMTAEFAMEYIGDFRPIQSALREISDSLNRVLAHIDQSARQVSGSAGRVSAGAQELAQGAAEQSDSIQKLSASIEDVSRRVGETTGRIRGMTQTVSNAVEDVANSSRKTGNMLDAMDGIRLSSDRIGKIIKSIDDIAFQTNILALNAAVEAARAGEAGKGFSVVADEVRNLAAKSAAASKETAALIHDTLEKVRNGFGLAEEAAKSSRQIDRKLRQLAGDMDEIGRTSAVEAAAVDKIRDGIARVSSVVQTNSATAEASAAESEELSGQAALLREEVGKFRLKT
jgi:methyl-accepting chemotaxis protein